MPPDNLKVPKIILEPAADLSAPQSPLALPDKAPTDSIPAPDPTPLVLPDRVSPVEDAFHKTQEADPDKAAKVLDLSKKLQAPASYVEKNLDSLQKANDAPTGDFFQQMETQYPGTAKWLGKPENMAIAHDQVKKLSEFEAIINDFKSGKSYTDVLISETMNPFVTMKDAAKEVSLDLAHGINVLGGSLSRVPAAAIDFSQLPGNVIEKYGTKLGVSKVVKEALKSPFPVPQLSSEGRQVTSPAWLRNNPVGELFDQNAKFVKTEALQTEILHEAKQGNYGKAGKALAAQVISGVPYLASLIVMGPAAGAAGAGVIQAGEVNARALNAGADPSAAATDAALQGLAAAALMKTGTFGILKKWSTALEGITPGATKELIKSMSKTMFSSTLTQSGQNAVNSFANDLSDFITGVNPDALNGWVGRAAESAAVGAGTGLALSALGGSQALMKRSVEGSHAAQSQEAQSAKDFYLNLGVKVTESKLSERAPEAQSDLISSLTKDTPVENVFIPVDAADQYFQSKNIDPEKAADLIGAGEAYREAKATGGDIQIPFSTWTRMADTEHYTGLADDVKFDRDAMTVRQSKEMKEHISETMKDLEKQAKEAPEPSEEATTAKESAKRVFSDVATQLEAIGEKKSKAAVFQRVFENIGRRIGVDPFELYQKYKYKFFRTKAEPPAVGEKAPALKVLKEAYSQADPQAQLERMFLDPVTRTLNERAFEELPVTPEKPNVAHISIEGIKFANDKISHMAGDDLYRYVGEALKSVDPQVAKVGGDFAIHVRDQAELDTLLEKARAALPEKMNLAGQVVSGKSFDLTAALGPSFGKAGEIHIGMKQGLEATGLRAPRGAQPLRFKALEGQIEPPPRTTKAVVGPAFKQALNAKTVDQAFLESHVDKRTGMLNYEAWNSLPKKAYRASVDLDGLKDLNDALGHENGNRLLETFSRIVNDLAKEAKLEHELDLTHKSGDEFLAQHDDWHTLRDFWVEAERRLADTEIVYKKGDVEITVKGAHFGAGIGENDAIAEQRLQERKAASKEYNRQQRDRVGGEGEKPAGPDDIRGIEAVRPSGVEAGDEPRGIVGGPGDRATEQALAENKAYQQLKTKAWEKSPIAQMKKSGIKLFIKPPAYDLDKQAMNSWEKTVKDFKNLGVPVATKKVAGAYTPGELANSLQDSYKAGDLHEHPFLKNLDPEKPDAELDELKDFFQDFRGKGKEDYFATGGQYKLGELADTMDRFNQMAKKPVPAFYSKLQKTIETKMGNSATADQVRGLIKDMPKEEVQWSGIEDFLKDNPKPSKTDLLDFLKANQLEIKEIIKSPSDIGDQNELFEKMVRESAQAESLEQNITPDELTDEQMEEIRNNVAEELDMEFGEEGPRETKFEKYTLPGGENYREMLFQLPPSGNKLEDQAQRTFGKSLSELTMDEKAELAQTTKAGKESIFTSSHFDEPNIFAHARVNERTDADGKKVLFIEEIQSDWHQKGRKEGYASGEKLLTRIPDGYKVNHVEAGGGSWILEKPDGSDSLLFTEVHARGTEEELRKAAESQALHELNDEISKRNSGVPDAPFKKNWHEVVLKRLIRYAAEKGFDKIAWTNGEQQAERYDLSKQVNSVKVEAPEQAQGVHFVDISIKGGKDLNLEVENGKVREGEFDGKLLADVIGKDMAEKILAVETGKSKNFSGLDLKVGGEGMKGFYDKIIPDYMNKFGKRYGAKVEETNFGKEQTQEEKQDPFGKPEEEKFKAHSMEITPALKEAALNEGFSLFQTAKGEGDEIAGHVEGIKAKQFKIFLHPKADASTVFHEGAHTFLEVLADAAEDPRATQDLKDDFQAVLNWMGVKDRAAIGREQHEMFARGFEARLREGNVPVITMRRIFDRFRDWLLGIYKSIKELDVKLTPEVRGVMDRMLASKEEIERAQHEAGYFDQPIVGATPELEARIKALREEARQIAEDTLLRPQMEEMTKKHMEFLNQERERLTHDATAEVDALPVFVAERELGEKHGGPDGAIGLANRYLEGKASVEEIADLERVAALHDYADGRELGQSISDADARSLRQSEIDRKVEMGMAEYDDMRFTPKIREEALKAIHEEKMLDLLALEKEAMSELMATDKGIRTGLSAAKRVTAQAVASMAREQAKTILANKPIKDAGNARPYITAQKNAAFRAGKAYAKKDRAAFEKASNEQILNHALASQAIKNHAQAEKYMNGLKPFVKMGDSPGKLPYANSRQIQSLLGRFGMRETFMESDEDLRQIAAKMLRENKGMYDITDATGFYLDDTGVWRQETLKDFQDRLNLNDIYAVDLPSGLFDVQGVKDTANMTLAQLEDLYKAIKTIDTHGRKANNFFDAQIKATIKEMAAAARAQAEDSIGTPFAANKRLGHKYSSELMNKIQDLAAAPGQFSIRWLNNTLTLCEALDGGHDGPWHDAIYRVLEHGEREKLQKQAKIREDMPKLAAKYFTDDELAGMKNRVYKFDFLHEDNQHLHEDEIMAMAFNNGNEGNLKRLLGGYGLDFDENLQSAQLKEIFSKLNKNHWDYVQEVWDYLHTYWPEILAQEMDLRGYTPKQVEPRPFTNEHGTYKGGYYPIEYDPTKSSEAFKNAEEASALYQQFSSVAAHTNDGHTQARARMVNRALTLSTEVLYNHLENVIHDLSFRRPVIDVARFLRQTDTKQALENAFGVKASTVLNDWLKNVASDQRASMQGGVGLLRWFRFANTVASIGWRPVMLPLNAGANIVNHAWDTVQDSIRENPEGFALKSMQFYKNPGQIKAFVDAKDPKMAQRYMLKDATIQEMAQRAMASKASKADHFFKTTAFIMEITGDMVTSYPRWLETYTAARAQGIPETKAVDLAQEAIVRSVGSGSMLDQAPFQRNEVFKTLAPYMSWSNMMFNRFWASGKIAGLEYRRENTGKAMAIIGSALFFGWGIQTFNESLWREIFRNAPANANQDDRKKRVLGRFLNTPFSYIPLMRDVAPYVTAKWTGERAFSPGLPLFDAMQTLVEPLADLGTDHVHFTNGPHVDAKFMEHMTRAALLAASKPEQISNWVFNFWDALHNGEATWKDILGGRRTKH